MRALKLGLRFIFSVSFLFFGFIAGTALSQFVAVQRTEYIGAFVVFCAVSFLLSKLLRSIK